MTNDDLQARIQTGEALLTEETAADAIAYFQALAEEYPHDVRVTFALAGAYDFAGQEADALEPYRQAAVLGLPDDLLPRWYVQYGSTLRNTGAYEHAVAVLSEGHERFPEDAAIASFLALALYNAEKQADALRIVLRTLVHASETGSVDLHGYQRALAWYADDLIHSPETPDAAPSSVG